MKKILLLVFIHSLNCFSYVDCKPFHKTKIFDFKVNMLYKDLQKGSVFGNNFNCRDYLFSKIELSPGEGFNSNFHNIYSLHEQWASFVDTSQLVSWIRSQLTEHNIILMKLIKTEASKDSAKTKFYYKIGILEYLGRKSANHNYFIIDVITEFDRSTTKIQNKIKYKNEMIPFNSIRLKLSLNGPKVKTIELSNNKEKFQIHLDKFPKEKIFIIND